MLGLQGKGWGTRDPFQFERAGITHLQGTLEGKGRPEDPECRAEITKGLS